MIAYHNVRRLALELVSGQPAHVQLYDMGVVLDQDEIVYQTCPAIESWETDTVHTEATYPSVHGGRGRSRQVSCRVWQSGSMDTWAITSERLVARDASGQLTSTTGLR